MDDNHEQMTFELSVEMPNRIDEEGQVDLFWSDSLNTQDLRAIARAGERMVLDGVIPSFDPALYASKFSVVTFSVFLAELDRLGVLPTVFEETTVKQTFQLVLNAWMLAKAVVSARDICAAAFVSSFTVQQSLQVLRETASSSDEVMPSWGSGNGLFRAMWMPTWTVQKLVSAREALVSGAPVQSNAKQAGMIERNQLTRDDIDWLIMRFVDVLVRRESVDVVDTTQSSAQSYRVMYRGEADVFEAWRGALGGQVATFPADGWLVARAMRQALLKSGWSSSSFDHRTGKPFYTLSFQLHPPETNSTSADWFVSYHVSHRFAQWSGPLRDWWQKPDRVWRIGAHTLVNPDSWILPKLREAAQVCPQIGQSMQLPSPVGCIIAADDVYEFLTVSAPGLTALGFSLETPDILEDSGARVRVRVQVKRTKADAKRQLSSGLQWFDANRIVDFDWSLVIDDVQITRDAFAQMVADQTPFIQVNGAWRLVPVAEILRQMEQLTIAQRAGARVLDLSRAILMSSDSEEVGLEVEYEDDALAVERVLDVFTQAVDPPEVAVPAEFIGTLRHYQHFGFSWLIHLRSIGCGSLLADDMGLGKTVQVLAYLLKLKEEQGAKGVHLLVCPTSLLPNWRAEIKRFAPELSVYLHHGTMRDASHVGAGANVDLVMTTYATLVRDIDVLSMYDFDAVIVDEAQNIKNADTKQAQAIRKIHSNHRIALTGTPIENRLEELWALMDFLNPGYLGSATWFRKTFADAALRNPGGGAAAKLQVLLRPVLLRRRKSDPDIQTELPDKWEIEERALLTSEQAAMYQAFVDQLFTGIRSPEAGTMSRRGQILATLVRLKQVCDHPSLISGGIPSARRSGKLRQIIELLQTVVDEGEGALVFTQFRDMGEILCDTIEKELSIRPKFLHGGLSASARGQMVDAFQRGTDASPILILSLRAGGVGLNLTRANHVFHFDRWWNPAVEDQATDRAYRIGQTKDVQVHKLICSGTLEERIDQLITTKRELSQAIVGPSNEWVTELDDDALRALFTLGPQSVWEEDEA